VSERELTYVEAVREATEQEMERDGSVIVFGLDVDDPKAIQGTTRGLAERYGSERVFGTPLSEDAMTGVAIGMSLAGLRPIHVHIRMDFLLLAMNQLVNIAAKARYMYGGQVRLPMVVRCIIGRSWGQGAQHSQGLHSLFMHTPGLRVVAPADPHDAKGCLAQAIRMDDPVIFVEHRLLYPLRGRVPAQSYVVPPGAGRVRREGRDVTLVGISHMATECSRAADLLAKGGIEAELIDPVWLAPLDAGLIVESVRRTRRLCVVDTAWLSCGASAEIVARVAEALSDGPPLRLRRLGHAASPCPPAPTLEALYYPDARRIAAAAYELVTGRADWEPGQPRDPGPEMEGPF
jgi:pyruvate/2-oxoglutarate/acetoin dehydrogenase E1 component